MFTSEVRKQEYIASKIMDAVSLGNDGSISMKGETPKTGYMVGGKSWTLTARPGHFDSYTVMDFLEAHKVVLSWSTVYVGWWTHKGRIYLDVSDNVPDFIAAYDLGLRRGEIAIWDIQLSSEVKVN